MESRAVMNKQMPIRLVVCHGIPERCFKFRGKPMRLCARCLGVLIGQTTAFMTLLFLGSLSYFFALALTVPMAIDWSVQRFTSLRSTNHRRFVTGLLGGVGVGMVQLRLLVAAGTWVLTLVAR